MILIMKMIQDEENDLSETDERACYICLEETNEFLNCACKTPVHFKCFYEFCKSNNTLECSICKIQPLEYTHLVDIEKKNQHLYMRRNDIQYALKWKIFFFNFVSMYLFFLFIIFLSSEYPLAQLTHPDFYVVLGIFTLPISATCSVKPSSVYTYSNESIQDGQIEEVYYESDDEHLYESDDGTQYELDNTPYSNMV